MSKRGKTEVDHSWLGQFETEGPFLSLPVVKSVWPTGVDRLGDTNDRAVTFKQAYADWLRAYDARTPDNRDEYAEIARTWIATVLDQLVDWEGLRVPAPDLPPDVEIHSPGEQIRVRPDGALKGRVADHAALLRIVDPSDDLRGPGLDGWSATEIDRMAALLRKADVEIGLVTDGRWWAIVWAHRDKPTGSAITDAATWGEEHLVRDAFLTLIDQRRFRAKDTDERLSKLLERSELEAEEITEALGTQVRKAVELLVGSFSRHRLEALAAGDPDPLPEKPDDVYQAAVTVMMRVVFLLFAEERGMLPTEKLYWDSYAIRDVIDDLQKRAAHGEELLDETYDTWHRLLAVSDALHGGVNYDEMRMPAYGGSLLDPDRFPWLSATDDKGLRIKVRDRVMLHVLKSVQYANLGKEARRISFRDIDVEQIGYIYEGLLGYTCTTVEGEVVLGLDGKDGEEPEIDAATLQELYDDSTDGKSFAKALRDWVKDDQPAAKLASVAKIAKAYEAELTDEQRAEVTRQLNPIVEDDKELLEFLVDWSALIRRDLRGIPLVVPVGGLVVTETPSRKHAGAHYTPRSLAEEVVQHALEPLVYEPGPLQENDRDRWQLKGSTAILDLKVADIAAGSGAFLVAAARFLAERVVEAWTAEDAISAEEKAQPDRAYQRAIREVIARCLYGADINPMAVEMCKLSLWLVSLDPTKPFSFVDDKIFCGNSLLGITDLDQLRRLHIYPDEKENDLITELVDVDGKLAEATRLRRELANPVVEHDPMRSRAGKLRLLRQAKEVTTELRDIADGIITAGLPHGGKPGRKLDDAYTALSWALSVAYPRDDSKEDRSRLDTILEHGLTPTVETDYARWQPTHWVIEAPDVFIDHGGFDAVIGNPPFLGGQKLTGAMGTDFRDWLINTIAASRRGSADLVAYFYLRATSLLHRNGTLGMIATNTVAQGDTREVGLDAMVADGFTITRAIQSRSWPASSANLEYAAVWGTLGPVTDNVPRVADDIEVRRISTLLGPVGRAEGNPVRLAENSGIAYIGCYVLGMGFVVESEEAQEWIGTDPRNAEVIFPYLNGDDLNSRPDSSASRWVIDFNDRTETEAAKYLLPFQRVKEQVKPERRRLKPDGSFVLRKPLPDRWWQYAEKRPALRKAIAELDAVLAIARVSKTVMPLRVPTEQVPSEACVVFASDSYSDQAVLSSNLHQIWAITYGSGMRNDPRYTPSDVFETFPCPEHTDCVETLGRILDEKRREIMLRRELGLTKLYNLVNDPEVQGDADVGRMREIQVEVDEATMEAYGWDDLPLDHGFHAYRQMQRWTVSPAARVEILDRLLELNHERARAEGQHIPAQEQLF
ncbi:type II restriction endonuclease subunit M [Saccharomonospora sp. CUA-673]|uniref:Eco57I restriction-modification methylase domain-containing protein n=1 Tax=Saccharomonospora sp. CUA-673 TaxID=1904969 RepID=UPI00095D5E9D|nr:DNA methyltransferase [Saccharomonospora sp. CUA-673]OLT45209.1 type II restriction endonuclease subunit M [Saccharomonospora sp. CUA-673]